MKKAWVQAVAATAALTVLQALLSFLAPVTGGSDGSLLPFVLASNALTATVLVWLARRLGARGLSRAAVLWAVWGGIVALSLAEAALFDIGIPGGDLPWIFAYWLAVSASFALLVGGSFPPARSSGLAPAASAPSAPWARLAASALAYVFLYFVAGTLAYPYLREFYESRPMPATATLLAIQPFRGLAFAAIVLLLVRRLAASRRAAALAAGVTLSVLGGVAPLIIPNPYLPDAVRLAHLPEVGVSNFLFGLLAGWLLAPPRAQEGAEAVALSA
ncbi:MAG TPA: hypothetical protein VMT87_11755 [Vicinamibacteria bacterium]|nr:hypothetical protein [Vicinamibacteria bacterium]